MTMRRIKVVDVDPEMPLTPVKVMIDALEYWCQILRAELSSGDVDGQKHTLETLTLRHDQLRKRMQYELYGN